MRRLWLSFVVIWTCALQGEKLGSMIPFSNKMSNSPLMNCVSARENFRVLVVTGWTSSERCLNNLGGGISIGGRAARVTLGSPWNLMDNDVNKPRNSVPRIAGLTSFSMTMNFTSLWTLESKITSRKHSPTTLGEPSPAAKDTDVLVAKMGTWRPCAAAASRQLILAPVSTSALIMVDIMMIVTITWGGNGTARVKTSFSLTELMMLLPEGL